MDDLLAFLRAQLDEDERVAREVAEQAPYDEWDAAGAQGEDDAARANWEVVRIARPYNRPDARAVAQHIARWDPARVLAEVEAKRRVLDRLFDDWGMCREDIASGTAKPVLALLAQPYAGRPGWREEWRV